MKQINFIPDNVKIISNGFEAAHIDQFGNYATKQSLHYTQKYYPNKVTARQWQPIDIVRCAVVDGKNKSSTKNAIERYTNMTQFDYLSGTYITNNNSPKIEDMTNSPISNLQLLYCDFRGSNLYYYLLSKEKYIWEISTITLLDISVNAGIAPGGYLKCDMIWAKFHRKLQLIRAGSEYHNAIVAGRELE